MENVLDRRSFLAGAAAIAGVAAMGATTTVGTAFAAEEETAKDASSLAWGEATEVTPFVYEECETWSPYPAEVEEDAYATLDDSWYAEPTGILEGKVAIITGASSGSGREMARLFAREGAKVVAVARREDRLRALMEEGLDYAGEIAGFKADLSDRGQVMQMIDFAVETFGGIDILVNNAAYIGRQEPAGVVEENLWDYMFELNVTAPLVATKYALPYMQEAGGGSIINIASIGGKYGPVGGVTYSSTKAALLGLTRNTGYLYQDQGIRCNAICPGGFETECSAAPRINDELGVEKGMNVWAGKQYNGKPQEVANVALFLASPASSYVNAQEIVADGAWTAGQ